MMFLVAESSNFFELIKTDRPIWLAVGAFIAILPKLIEWFIRWKSGKDEINVEKRKIFLDRLDKTEKLISEQQDRYLALHDQLINERDQFQQERMDLKKHIFNLERRVQVLESIMREHEIILDEGTSDASGL